VQVYVYNYIATLELSEEERRLLRKREVSQFEISPGTK
jgi:hypothetical protein